MKLVYTFVKIRYFVYHLYKYFCIDLTFTFLAMTFLWKKYITQNYTVMMSFDIRKFEDCKINEWNNGKVYHFYPIFAIFLKSDKKKKGHRGSTIQQINHSQLLIHFNRKIYSLILIQNPFVHLLIFSCTNILNFTLDSYTYTFM